MSSQALNCLPKPKTVLFKHHHRGHALIKQSTRRNAARHVAIVHVSYTAAAWHDVNVAQCTALYVIPCILWHLSKEVPESCSTFQRCSRAC